MVIFIIFCVLGRIAIFFMFEPAASHAKWIGNQIAFITTNFQIVSYIKFSGKIENPEKIIVWTAYALGLISCKNMPSMVFGAAR